MVKKKLYANIFFGDKIWGTIILEMVRYDVSMKAAVTTDVK